MHIYQAFSSVQMVCFSRINGGQLDKEQGMRKPIVILLLLSYFQVQDLPSAFSSRMNDLVCTGYHPLVGEFIKSFTAPRYL